MHPVLFGVFIIGTLLFLCYVVYITIMRMVQDKVEREAAIIDGMDIELSPGVVDDELIQKPGLYIFSGDSDRTKLVCESPTLEIIEILVKSNDWTDISFVILAFGQGNYIEVSGSLDEGFSSCYKDGDHELFANTSPESIQEMTDIFCDFLQNKKTAVKKYGFS
ncbi:hypothetical protein [Alishewanella jeotgali]|uniref:Uncharacterized protein n=1 Tax=Alishewanella jeotgali KCTC 22429 TaxID=1129374 RepID=H3ZH94_9ALTE|nr:hypothetical protein [Alishewanella jeotgali]EHR40050.1 hypothetical protein AJE_13824 [Alishewanella jeotgali KCTC 22429]